MNNILIKFITMILSIVFVSSSFIYINSDTKMYAAESPKELENVISQIKLLDVSGGRTVPMVNDVYQIVKGAQYRYETNFDLTEYDGNLQNGDFFNFTIPQPLTVNSTQFELKDEKTGVFVGDVVVNSNGEGQGATVTITLKNLDEYLLKTGGSQVQGVKGTFYVDFKINEVVGEQLLSYDKTETKQLVEHKISVKERVLTDYTESVGRENFSKLHGVIKKQNWNSDLLNQSGEYLHPFTIRINARQAEYNTITVHDYISENHAPTQFIPETLVVRSGYYDSTFTLVPQETLVLGKDYIVIWNNSYTDFTVKILNASERLAINGKPASYDIKYSTTAPANGTDIGNYVQMQGDEQQLTTTTTTTVKKALVVRSSKVTEGGTIQVETGYRITLYKVDSETAQLLNGADFEITSPDGSKEIVRIEKDGMGQSRVYSSEEVAQGDFTIREIKAPDGYILDPKSYTVKVGESGVIRTIKNQKIEAPTTEAPTTEEPTTEEPTIEAPTIEAPTTEAPTTEAPTTEEPTTEAPTIEEPTTEESTTEAPTTEAPTTEAPTTEEPTTEEPTTEEPTTEAPTTEAPTTEAPTTEAPTTEAPTTEEPTTEAPTIEEPTTEESTTEAPTTEAPTTEAPTTEAPTTEEPTTEEPTTEEPTTEEPTTEAPTTEAPTTEAPTTEAPTTEAPTTEAPTTEEPTTEAPTTEEPTTEEPTTEVPTTEAPTTEAPTTEEPTTEAPTTEAPTTEEPTTEAPTTEAPTTEAPTTEEPTTEEPTTEVPTTEVPTTEVPTTEAPTTEAPTTEEPTTEAPTTEAPTTEAPTTEEPTTTEVPNMFPQVPKTELPNKPVTPDDNIVNNTPKGPSNSVELPDTGEVVKNTGLISLILILTGGLIYITTRRNK
ncbi:hypothetical protein KFV08_11325 [Macrococcoides canis]|uniref:prealbumin-like fold domain-containing protein n=2 Tax=Macrococcoides canis TaxID=1855823 RepID=UPI0020B8D4F6|nr:prealbumin-like fold domain-containing protein [Macrococcus canis]UTH09056.1 hypothetical protein KFV08_11325 [Macrococcus canis]